MASDRAPLLSIIVPVFNKREWLGACLDSVLSQSPADFEVICVDDASSDGSAEILARYAGQDGRVRVLRQPYNAGAGPARNRGIDAARGRYLRMVDADDLLPPDSLKPLWQLAEASGCVAARGSLAPFPDGPHKQWLEANCAFARVGDDPGLDLDQAAALWVPWFHTTYLFRRRFITEHAIRYPHLRDGEDPVFLARVLAHAGRIATMRQVCYLYRSDIPSVTQRNDFWHLKDYLIHIAIMRNIYDSWHREHWVGRCLEFYLPCVAETLRSVTLGAAEFAEIAALMTDLWSPVELGRAGIALDRAAAS